MVTCAKERKAHQDKDLKFYQLVKEKKRITVTLRFVLLLIHRPVRVLEANYKKILI